MNVGRTLGYVLLALVDALLVPVFVFVAGLVVVQHWLVADVYPQLFVLAGVSFVGAVIAALVFVRRDGKPFPVTRGTKRAFDWVLTWFP